MLADITNNVNIGCQAASAPPSWSTGSFGPLSQLQKKKYRLLAQLLSRLSRCPDRSGLPEAGECTNAQALSRTYHRTASDVIHRRPWPNCSSRSRQAEPGHKTMWMPLSICWSSLRGRPIFCSGETRSARRPQAVRSALPGWPPTCHSSDTTCSDLSYRPSSP